MAKTILNWNYENFVISWNSEGFERCLIFDSAGKPVVIQNFTLLTGSISLSFSVWQRKTK